MLQLLGDSGPVVLFLPGGAEAVEGFFPGLAEDLMADPGCRVILFDRPGTVGAEVDGPLTEATGAIHTMLGGLGVGPVVAIGQSLGGAVALLLARDHPEDVAGLVLLDATPVNDVALARQAERTARTAARLAQIRPVGRLLTKLLRSTAEKSAKRHGMRPEARAATLKIATVDLVQLSRAATGLEAIARGFDESQLPHVPAAVVTADRKPKSAVHQAHQRLATALGVPLLSWPGADHQVHLTHPDEVLEASREVLRTAAAIG